MQSVSLTLPLFIGGALQWANDIAFYIMFRDVKPPEEIAKKEFNVQSSRSDSAFCRLNQVLNLNIEP